jgi:N-acyl-D-amino-acid deacylase
MTRKLKARRIVVAALLAAFVGFLEASEVSTVGRGHLPMTGQAVPSMESYDRIIPDLMARWGIPGGAVAVVKDGCLVFARGYGYADRENGILVQPDSLFRIASVSKPITAIAAMKLVEEGKLDLDAEVFDLLSDLKPRPGASRDPRLAQIQVRDLLQHSGGWDSERGFDPMFEDRRIAQAMGVPSPPSCTTIIEYMLGQRLDFTPGTRFAYSNFGYCVLGRVIEAVTGESYEQYVKERVLAPLGITWMQIGRSLPQFRAEGEVKYYDFPGAGLGQSVFDSYPGMVPWPDGGFHLEAMDAHGSWIASAVDLVKLIASVEGSRLPQLLSAQARQQMLARPSLSDWRGTDSITPSVGGVRPTGGGEANWWHAGSLPGTWTILVRAYNGLVWAALFNSRPCDDERVDSELDGAMWEAAGGVTRWPDHDLFEDRPETSAQDPDEDRPPATMTVCPSGCKFATIQAAIDAAGEGDVIEIQPGTYRENVMIFEAKSLTLRGAHDGTESVTIDGSLSVTDRRPGLLVQSSEAIVIQGLQIVLSDTGIWVVGSSTTISQVEVRENAFGMVLTGAAEVTIEESTVNENTDRGLGIFEEAQVVVVKSTITENGATGGISVSGNASLTLDESAVVENVFVGVWVGEDARAVLPNNQISRNREGASGIALIHRAQVEISGNTIEDNSGCGVGLFEDQGITIAGQDNAIAGNGQNLCGDLGKFPSGFGGGR